jgi:hypothetical protein
MTFNDRTIVEAYSKMFEGPSNLNKLELIKSLSRSLRTESKKKRMIFMSLSEPSPLKNHQKRLFLS